MSSIKLTADSGGGTVELKAPATTGSNAAKQLYFHKMMALQVKLYSY